MSKSFLQRLSLGLLLSFITAFFIYFSHNPWFQLPFLLLLLGFILVSLWEYFDMMTLLGYNPRKKTAFLFSTLYLLALAITPTGPLSTFVPTLVWYVALIVLFSQSLQHPKKAVLSIAVTLLGVFWITLPLACLYQINYFFPSYHPQAGPMWLFYLMLVTKMGDIFAYFVGKQWGRKKLAHNISPNKTWEGAFGGLIASVGVSVAFTVFTPLALSLVESFFLGLALGLLAQIGDLAESLLKRDASIKDSNKIPGLGGVLDIMDSLLLTAPFLFLYIDYKWMVI